MPIVTNRNKALGGREDGGRNSMRSLPIDVTVSESHSWGQKLTDKPVEGGARVSDNIVLKPREVTLSGYLITDDEFTMQEKLEMLEALRTDREPFTVVTSLKVYDSMFFSSDIKIARAAKNARALKFSVNLKYVSFIASTSNQVEKGDVAKTHDPYGREFEPSEGLPPHLTGHPSSDLSGARSRTPSIDLGKKSLITRSDHRTAKDESWIQSLI